MEKKENKTLDLLLKVFLLVGIVAGVCVIVKILYDKYKQNLCMLCDEDADCNFECLENDALDCDCDSCEFNKTNCCNDDQDEKVVDAEASEETAEM